MLDNFAQSLLVDEPELSEMFIAPRSFNTNTRFDVYRNNVMTSLIDALQANFPVIFALVGESAFVGLAKGFIRQCPPESPYLFEYGEGFAEFLDACEQLDKYPYIPDVARLEFKLMRSTHAADAEPVHDALVSLAQDPERLAVARLKLAPSLYLFATDYAVGTIWQAHQSRLTHLQDIEAYRSEWLMISRPEFRAELDWLEPQEFEFISALREGNSIEESLAGLTADFDLSACFGRLLSRRIITGIQEENRC